MPKPKTSERRELVVIRVSLKTKNEWRDLLRKVKDSYPKITAEDVFKKMIELYKMYFGIP